MTLEQAVEQAEIRHIAVTLEKHGGRKHDAAVELDISMPTLHRRIARHAALEQWRRGRGRPTKAEVPTALRLAEAPVGMEVADASN